MNAPVTLTPLTAIDWIEREIADLTKLRDRLTATTELRALQSAVRWETAATISASGLADESLPPAARQTLLWQAGRHALKGKVYRALASTKKDQAA